MAVEPVGQLDQDEDAEQDEQPEGDEVQHLVEVLRRTSDMTPAQLALVEARFRKNDL